jgi:hypothetical protein
LEKRGKEFEEMCNAKLEKKFRTYEGLVMNVGTVEMLADSAGDVSKDIPFAYEINI